MEWSGGGLDPGDGGESGGARWIAGGGENGGGRTGGRSGMGGLVAWSLEVC